MNTRLNSHIQCPYCGARLASSAYRCDSCGRVLYAKPDGHSTRVDPADGQDEGPARSPDTQKRPPRPPRGQDNTWLWVIMCAAGVLFVFGIVFLFLSHTHRENSKRTAYNYLKVTDNRTTRQSETPQENVAAGSTRTHAIWLMDLVKRDRLAERITPLRLGQNFPAGYSTRGYRISGSGIIRNNSVTTDFYIEPDGSIHGRYHNANGVSLDVNGYMDRNGNIRLRLGHDAETSYWTLYHQEGFRYTGYWGRQDVPSSITFRIR